MRQDTILEQMLSFFSQFILLSANFNFLAQIAGGSSYRLNPLFCIMSGAVIRCEPINTVQ